MYVCMCVWGGRMIGPGPYSVGCCVCGRRPRGSFHGIARRGVEWAYPFLFVEVYD